MLKNLKTYKVYIDPSYHVSSEGAYYKVCIRRSGVDIIEFTINDFALARRMEKAIRQHLDYLDRKGDYAFLNMSEFELRMHIREYLQKKGVLEP